MQRRNRFLAGFLSAAITFGALTAFLGPRHFHPRYGGFHHDSCWQYAGHHHPCCCDGAPQDSASIGR